MRSITYCALAVTAISAVGCGGSGGGTPLPNTEFVFATQAVPDTTPNTLYLGKVSDPSHPVALHTLAVVNKVFRGAAIDPATGKIYYHDTTTTTDVRVVNPDGTGDQLFYSRPNLNGVSGFLPDGRLIIAADVNGNNTRIAVDIATKVETILPDIGGQPQPSIPGWRRDSKEFTYLWFDNNTADFQVWKMDVATSQGSLVANNAFGGQFAPDNTILSPDALSSNLNRYSETGALLAKYPVNRGFTAFFQVGSVGFLENGGGNGAPNIMYYKYRGSSPVNVTPTVPGSVILFDAEIVG